MSNWPKQIDVDAFYGNPRGRNGTASPKWESDNIVRVKAPWKLVTSWDFTPVSAVRVHEKCSDSLARVFDKIWASADQDQAKIDEWGMNLFAGAYTFRVMRGGNRLSMHSWGCAIDFDSDRNKMHDARPHFSSIQPVLDAFASEGWTWGGSWSDPDGMHWQAADV